MVLCIYVPHREPAAPASARSIVHSVWPPLTAITKCSRSVTAVRASLAIKAAGRPAASSSASSSIGMAPPCPALSHYRILPATWWGHIPIHFAGSPAARLVFVDGCRFLQYRIDDPPSFFDIVLSCKQRPVAVYGVTEHAFICIHFVCARTPARQQFNLFANLLVIRVHHRCAESDGHFGTDAKPQMIRNRLAMGKDPRRLAKAHNHLGASNGERFSGTDIKWYSLPAPGIDLQLQRSERLHLRVRGDARFLPITTKLSAHQIVLSDRWNRSQNLDLLVTQ